MAIPNLFFDAFEPRTILAMGGLVSCVITAMLLLQASSGRTYRQVLYTLACAVALNAVSLGILVIVYDDPLSQYNNLAIMAASASFMAGAFCLIVVYRPNFQPSICMLSALICVVGYALCSSVGAARNWNNICQFSVALLAIVSIARSRDPQAPGLRWVALGLVGLSVVAMLPRMLTLFQPGLDPHMSLAPVVSVGYRIRLIIWAVYPILLYACVTSIIHARLAAKLRNAADLDVLTGAHSRRYLFEAGEQILDRRAENQSNSATVLLIDVDHFKKVNDQWGHLVGDSVLKHCVDCIREVVRGDDAVIGRYGGEEFCILLSKSALQDATGLAERIRLHLADNPYRQGDVVVAVTVSIGVAQDPGQGTLDTLIKMADERLYRAKNGGRNRVIDQGALLVPV